MLKYAKVVPIHKAKSKQEVTNYRPISLLPLFNKIFEKLMHIRLIKFLELHKIIFKHQFGFQKEKSTSLAILDLCTQLVEAIENKKFSCCIFLDLAKAFDTDHAILISKLEYYGIRGIALEWFKSYLTNRTQKVSINGTLSDSGHIKFGVPQGSVLGPLLFLLYINDMPLTSSTLKFHLFADDTSIFFSHNKLEELESIVNNELAKVSDWLIANKLTLNVDKSNFIIISSAKKTSPHKVALTINNSPLIEKDSIKYLGVLIDKNLTWKQQIKQVNIKISKGIGILAKMRHYVPSTIIRNLYFAFIAPFINYGLINWGSATASSLKSVHRNVNKALRIMNFDNYTASSKPIFQKFGILNFEDSFKLECAKFMYDISKGNSIDFLSELFEKTTERHSYQTRQATTDKFAIPLTKTNLKKRFITFQGTKIWNNIPFDIRNKPSKTTFQRHFRKWLIQKYN